jgi:BirA family biotin operon repressor/biotin-[acetyl-CoA-carboxylase] ligase
MYAPLSTTTIQNGLTTTLLGHRLVLCDEIESTNTLAMDLASQGAPEGTLVVAETQTRGRGRLGRTWYSPKGLNLYLSLILHPSCAARKAPWLGLAAAVAVSETISKHSGLTARVKWPNDVEVSSRKVAGILTELTVLKEQVESLILGIGVNLNMERSDLPADLQPTATSLRIESGRPVDRTRFLQELLADLEAWYGIFRRSGIEGIRSRYLDLFEWLGRRVWIQLPDGRLHGEVSGLSSDGGLLFRLSDGKEIEIRSGEVVQMRAFDAARD